MADPATAAVAKAATGGMHPMEIAALLLFASAMFGWINHRFLRLPHTIGMLIMSLVASLALLGASAVMPGLGIEQAARAIMTDVDFAATLMQGMLAYLLFAGALHVDFATFRKRRIPILVMATAGVLISTAVVGVSIWQVSSYLGMPIPLPWALAFGAIISPTDPIAVISILKRMSVPKNLYATVEGESLFNDGMAVIAFSVLVAYATGRGHVDFNVTMLVGKFTIESGGAILLGLTCGMLAFHAIKRVDDTTLEVLITLALATGVYAVAHRLHMSGPIAVVVAGIFIGNRSSSLRRDEKSSGVVFGFWHVVDDILNSLLFLLIGAEVLLIARDMSFLPLAAAAVPIMILGRYAAVALPVVFLSLEQKFERGTIPLLTWGGVRGGISVALALSLPDNQYKPTILAVTFAVVIFSVVVQGLTVRHVIDRFVSNKDSKKTLDEVEAGAH